jgi:hypothetical protein
MRWSDIPFQPSTKMLRQFGLLCLFVFGGMAAWRGVTKGADTVVWVSAAAAVVLGVLGLVRPACLKPVFVVWMVAAFPIGWLVSQVVLLVMYYGVFTPIGFLMRLRGRDLLGLRANPQVQTYWRPKREEIEVRRYFQQY